MSETIDQQRRIVRTDILRQIGASAEESEALLAYNENLFRLPEHAFTLPLPDEAFAGAWQSYAQRVRASGSIRSLEPFLVQLRFPIHHGISSTSAYLDVTQAGRAREHAAPWTGIQWADPAGVEVEVYGSVAGAIATITAANHGDFVRLVQALARKNEPEPLPPSMGALMIAGYRNWQRVHAIQEGNDAAAAAEILRDRSSFQDRFILLSREYYSGVTPAQIGLDASAWRELSWLIRREHEVAHYFCKRVLGSMRNNLLDEMIADYCGIVRACGRFRADWFLLFLGLEDYPHYRSGARFENYRGAPAMSDRALMLLQKLVHRAALVLGQFDDEFDHAVRATQDQAFNWPAAVMAIASLHLEEFTRDDALELLRAAYARTCSQVHYSIQREEVAL